MNEVINFLPTLLIFLGGLSILVLVHELGHFLAAKRAGIRVDEFGLGFPPRLFAIKKGETVYSLNAIPIGGFVRLHGEDDQVTEDLSRSFFNKSKPVRAAIIVAGVLMNFVLAIIIFSVVAWHTAGQVVLREIQKDTPAELAGLKPGDIVTKIDGREVYLLEEFQAYIVGRAGQEVSLEIDRDGKPVAIRATPRKDPPEGEGHLGVGLELRQYPTSARPLTSLKHGIDQTFFWIGMTFQGVKVIGGDLIQGKAPEGVSGPIGILRVTDQVAKFGVISLLNLMGIISINLAVINLLPIPALDGGRLLFIIVEAIFGRKVLPTFEKYAHNVGFILLITLILLVTFKDISNWVSGVDLFATPE